MSVEEYSAELIRENEAKLLKDLESWNSGDSYHMVVGVITVGEKSKPLAARYMSLSRLQRSQMWWRGMRVLVPCQLSNLKMIRNILRLLAIMTLSRRMILL
jgi:hypothetical protein